MFRFGIAAICLASAASAADLCAQQPTQPIDALVAKTCTALSAVNQKDRATLNGLMAEDFALTSVSGAYYAASKEEMVKRWTEQDETGTATRSSLTSLHRLLRLGSVGFVAGVIEDRTNTGNIGKCSSHTFTDIWVERAGTWLWLQSHESGFKNLECKP